MNKCLLCKTWYEPAKDSYGHILNASFCEPCLEGKRIHKLEKDSQEELWREYS